MVDDILFSIASQMVTLITMLKRVKLPTGVPKSMDDSKKEMERLPSRTCSVGELPPELQCLLCKEVMEDAALTNICRFQSFCMTNVIYSICSSSQFS
ncbi:hypothetical protein Bca52824_018429 [Brassica carinata]|uniref:Uncharacterized protein n=1 Tax=Brassica carinata TaxID=52824 RepID=A0A8X8AYI0_BRACI|nr:hypothetical protein Bca52824_018429 [Brassica carinata]